MGQTALNRHPSLDPGRCPAHEANDILRRELDSQCRPNRAEAERTQDIYLKGFADGREARARVLQQPAAPSGACGPDAAGCAPLRVPIVHGPVSGKMPATSCAGKEP